MKKHTRCNVDFDLLLSASLDDALGILLRLLIFLYFGLSALLALVFAVIIIGISVAYVVLRFAIRLVQAEMRRRGSGGMGCLRMRGGYTYG